MMTRCTCKICGTQEAPHKPRNCSALQHICQCKVRQAAHHAHLSPAHVGSSGSQVCMIRCAGHSEQMRNATSSTERTRSTGRVRLERAQRGQRRPTCIGARTSCRSEPGGHHLNISAMFMIRWRGHTEQTQNAMAWIEHTGRAGARRTAGVLARRGRRRPTCSGAKRECSRRTASGGRKLAVKPQTGI